MTRTNFPKSQGAQGARAEQNINHRIQGEVTGSNERNQQGGTENELYKYVTGRLITEQGSKWLIRNGVQM